MSMLFDVLRMSQQTGNPTNDPSGRVIPTTPAPEPPPQPLTPTQSAVYAAAFVSLAAVLSPVTQYNLSPVYGSIPTSQYQQQLIVTTALLAFVTKGVLRPYLKSDARFVLPVWGYYIPPIQWLLFSYSARFGSDYGPLITQAATYAPVLFLSFLSAIYALEALDLQRYGSRVADGLPAAGLYGLFFVVERLAAMRLPAYVGTWDFFTRSGLQLLVASGYAFMSSSQYLLFAVPALLHTILSSPHYHSVTATRRLNATLATYGFSLLDRKDSLTGYISVLENRKDEFRVLRCDHSLLGGEWLVNAERAAKGQTSKETIYSVFTMLESIRLVTSAGSQPDTEKKALFVGLGIGTSPSAFIAHGIDTTIVELDPVVHKFATQYFDLPSNHTAHITDAVPWVAKTSVTTPNAYDYIIHDVFTGGAEPTALFTQEFLTGLSSLLSDTGVIAINYAGDMTLPPPRIVLNTIHAVFPTCRIFRDTEPDTSSETFLNMVVFCTKQAGVPIRFRTATPQDFLGSMARRQWIPPQDDLEILWEDVKKQEWKGEVGEEDVILKAGEEHRVERYHAEAARRHWKIMRTVLPDAVWELW